MATKETPGLSDIALWNLSGKVSVLKSRIHMSGYGNIGVGVLLNSRLLRDHNEEDYSKSQPKPTGYGSRAPRKLFVKVFDHQSGIESWSTIGIAQQPQFADQLDALNNARTPSSKTEALVPARAQLLSTRMIGYSPTNMIHLYRHKYRGTTGTLRRVHPRGINRGTRGRLGKGTRC